MRTRILALATLAIVALPIVAQAQYDERYAGPEIGVFIPSDANLRNALGGTWYSFGISTMKQGSVVQRKLGTNFNLINQSKNGNKVFLGSYTLGLVMPLGSTGTRNLNTNFQPYFAVRGGLNYTDYAITSGTRLSAKRLGYNLNAELGVQVGDRFTLSARYDLSPSYDGFDFNGVSFALKYGIFKF
ncbi:MAG: hypothetical protein ACKVQS_14740 [Fimbriimonadaceae bacterium]